MNLLSRGLVIINWRPSRQCMIKDCKDFSKWLHNLMFIFFILFTGCTSLDSEYHKVLNISQTSLPNFVKRVFTSNYDNEADGMCIEISQRELWEPGNMAQDLAVQLTENSHIVVDGQVLSQERISSSSWATNTIAFDKDGGPSGTVGGDMSFCFKVDYLEIGVHNTTFETQTLSGKNYSYTWRFEVSAIPKSTINKDIPTLTSTK